MTPDWATCKSSSKSITCYAIRYSARQRRCGGRAEFYASAGLVAQGVLEEVGRTHLPHEAKASHSRSQSSKTPRPTRSGPKALNGKRISILLQIMLLQRGVIVARAQGNAEEARSVLGLLCVGS